jgi:hypothetical protein
MRKMGWDVIEWNKTRQMDGIEYGSTRGIGWDGIR